MQFVTVEVLGDKIVEEELLTIAGRAANPSEAFLDVEEWLIEFARQQFATEGKHGHGTGWAPLKSSTISKKAIMGNYLEILQETQDMYDSLTDVEDSHNVNEQTVTEMIWGSTTQQFELHSRGVPGMFPKREIFDFTLAQQREVAQIFQDYIVPRVRPSARATPTRSRAKFGTMKGRKVPIIHPKSVDKTGRVLPARGPGGKFVSS